MQFQNKRKTYPGRWIVKAVEAGLIFAIIFFTINALNDAFAPIVMDEAPAPQTLEYRIIPQTVDPVVVPQETALDEYDYFSMALDHQLSGNYYDAIADYNRALQLNPDLAASWLNRGVAYEQLGNNYNAMHDYLNWMTRNGVTVEAHDTTMMPGESAEVELAEGLVYQIPFRAYRGQTIDISATAVGGDAVDPIIMVVDRYGNPVAADDDILRADGSLIAMNSFIDNMMVDNNGCMGSYYTLLVTHAGGGSYGTVEISMSLD